MYYIPYRQAEAETKVTQPLAWQNLLFEGTEDRQLLFYEGLL